MTVEGPSSLVERGGGTSEGPSSNPRGGEGEWDGCVCSCRGLVAFGSVRGPAGVGFAHPFQVQALRALGLSA